MLISFSVLMFRHPSTMIGWWQPSDNLATNQFHFFARLAVATVVGELGCWGDTITDPKIPTSDRIFTILRTGYAVSNEEICEDIKTNPALPLPDTTYFFSAKHIEQPIATHCPTFFAKVNMKLSLAAFLALGTSQCRVLQCESRAAVTHRNVGRFFVGPK